MGARGLRYCGTFGRVGSAEGQFALKAGRLVSFSEEELCDCIGWDKDQYSWFSPKGFMTTADYPYNLTSYPPADPPVPGNPCRFDPKKVVPGRCVGCTAGGPSLAAMPYEHVGADTALLRWGSPHPRSDHGFFNGTTGAAPDEKQLAAFVHHNGPVSAGINANVFGLREKGCEARGDCFITEQMCNEESIKGKPIDREPPR
jgi:hypothetical protein